MLYQRAIPIYFLITAQYYIYAQQRKNGVPVSKSNWGTDPHLEDAVPNEIFQKVFWRVKHTHVQTNMKIFLYLLPKGAKKSESLQWNISVNKVTSKAYQMVHTLNPLLNSLFYLQLRLSALIELHDKGGSNGRYLKDVVPYLVIQSFTLSH